MKHYVTYNEAGDILAQGTVSEGLIDMWKERLVNQKALFLDEHLENADAYQVIDDQLVERTQAKTQDLTYDFYRHKTYDIGGQLGMLFDDIEAGLFGAKAKTGKFYAYIKAIKEQYPKP